MAYSGYDVFLSEPGQHQEMKCQICGSLCQVTRNVNGPTSWTGAMAKIKRLHDQWLCPHTGKKWHEDAYQIIQFAINCPPSLKKYADKDLRQLIVENIG